MFGEALILKVGASAPVPLIDSLCVPPIALSDNLNVAVSLTALEGVKMILITQLLPAASVKGETGHVFVCAKSLAFAPTIEILLTVILALPVLLKVMPCAALAIPIAWLANVTVDGDKVATGALLTTFVPIPTSTAV